MLKIGIDYWETISQDPDKYREIAQAFMDNGIDVHIVSAVGSSDAQRILNEINSHQIPHTMISMIICEGDQVPDEKLKYAVEYKLDFFIDNRKDVCELLRKNGILTWVATTL